MDAITVKCPTCELAGYTTLCVCGGAGQIVIDPCDFAGAYEITPLMLCADDGSSVPYSNPRRSFFEHFAEEPSRDDPRIACWGLYACLSWGGVENIADFRSPEEAQAFQDLLTEIVRGKA